MSEITFTGSGNFSWKYKVKKSGKTVDIKGPCFEIEGKQILPQIINLKQTSTGKILRNGVNETVLEGEYLNKPGLKLRMYVRLPGTNPVLRFRYELVSEKPLRLTKSFKKDSLTYLSTTIPVDASVKEIRFSEFNELVHSFTLSERNVTSSQFENGAQLMGPMLTSVSQGISSLVAYEHGSQVPDAYLSMNLEPDRNVAFKAVKGNYFDGEELNAGHSFSTIWFDVAAIAGSETELAAAYREFVLKYMSENLESRKPYIFYNTWNFQERNRWWYKKAYLADMTQERMITEIEVAHQMGIEVFVIDAGWFEKTGDWEPSKLRFPNKLKDVTNLLNKYGMKLGLWFNPTAAAVSSKILASNRGCVKTWNGKEEKPNKIWETEESYNMCLVSKYRDDFADELIRNAKENGVTYFKWDGISQHGCNDPHHFHGNEKNTPEERAESFSFELGKSMTYIIDKLCAAVPGAIVDFDITEGGRAVGLGFLASGKYFLVNNGPYYSNYDIPFERGKTQSNVFFYPGPARTWITRTPLTFDKWIPSVLLLTHYLPDDPYENQSLAVGSLILGQNGIWGDLPSISKEGIDFFGKTLTKYKDIRNDITEATIIRNGAVGGSPEVYEKINPLTGKGTVVVFSSHPGTYHYITENLPDKSIWATRETNVSFDKKGHAVLTLKFEKAESKIVFFGVKNN